MYMSAKGNTETHIYSYNKSINTLALKVILVFLYYKLFKLIPKSMILHWKQCLKYFIRDCKLNKLTVGNIQRKK